MWCKLAGGNTLPSCFLASRLNSAEACCLTLYNGTYLYHSSGVVMLPPCFPQSKAVLCVFKGFLGTHSVLSLLTSSSVLGSANLQQEELVGGLEEKLVGRSWRSGHGWMKGRS